MEYDNTKAKGGLAELEALTFFSRAGFTVSLPFGDNAPYDLVVESPSGVLYRVQIRFAGWQKNGSLVVNLRRSASGKNIPLDRTRIEAFVVWDGACPYIVPTQDLGDVVASLTLRHDPPKNRQCKGIRMASTFKEALHLLP